METIPGVVQKDKKLTAGLDPFELDGGFVKQRVVVDDTVVWCNHLGREYEAEVFLVGR